MTAVLDVIAGARPNFMKVGPILRELASRGGPFRARLVHTGQHYDESLSEVFFRQLDIPAPDVHLGAGSGSHGEQTARVLAAYEKLLLPGNPRPGGGGSSSSAMSTQRSPAPSPQSSSVYRLRTWKPA